MPIFAIPNKNGALAERLGTGLQNLLQRFDSARHLKKTPFSDAERGFAILDITIIVADLRDRGYDAELLVEEDDDVPLAKQTFSLMIWPGLPWKISGQRQCVEIGRTAISTIWNDNLRRFLPRKVLNIGVCIFKFKKI